MAIDDPVNRCWRRAELEEYASGKLEQRLASQLRTASELRAPACQQLLANIFDSGASPEWLGLRGGHETGAAQSNHRAGGPSILARTVRSEIESRPLPATVGRYRWTLCWAKVALAGSTWPMTKSSNAMWLSRFRTLA